MYLGASQNCYYTEKTWDNIKIIDNKYYYAYKTLGTFAISFHNSIYEEVLNKISLFEEPTDVALFIFQKKYFREIIVCYPNIVSCNVINSLTNGKKINKTIQTERAQKCKWILKYDTREKIVVPKKNNTIKLHINSLYNDHKINVDCKNKIAKRNNIITIECEPIDRPKIIILYNIFIDKYELC